MTHTVTIPTPKSGPAPFPIPTDLWIGGKWVEGSAKKRVDVFDPSTATKITDVADCDAGDALAAVDAADKAAAGWAATTPRARAEIRRKCYEKIVGNIEWLAYLISLENGKALPDSRSEVLYAAEFYRWYAEETCHVLGEIAMAPASGARILVQYQPMGIALLITPWNYPAAMATRKIAPALAAGCTVVLKPATETPLTAFAVAQIMHDCGVPAGVVNVVTTAKAVFDTACLFLAAVLVAVSLWVVVDVVRGNQDSWQVGLACVCSFFSGWLLKAIVPDRKAR